MSHSAAVITVSDKGYAGQRTDTSGPRLVQLLQEAGYDVVYTALVPDEKELIQKELLSCADERGIHLVLTTGGTGFSPRDITPEATEALLERRTPGIPEYMRIREELRNASIGPGYSIRLLERLSMVTLSATINAE